MTALTTLSGLDVLDGYLVLPRAGLWTFEGVLDADEPPVGQVDLKILGDGAPPVTFRGYVAHGSAPAGTCHVWIVGGQTGGFSGHPSVSKSVEGRDFDGDPIQVTALRLIRDLCEEVGETLDETAEAGLAALSVPAWHRVAGAAGLTLQAVCTAFGLDYRILPNGNLWAGVDAFPDASEEPIYVDPIDDGFKLHLAPRSASYLPGQTVDGRQIGRVDYTIGSALRARLWYRDV